MKTCSTCSIKKPLDEFYRNSRAKDGRDSRCISCEKLRLAKWASENPDRVKAAQRRYNSSEKAREKARRWAEQNPERYLQVQADYRARHPESVREASRKHYHSNLERSRRRVLIKKAERRTKLANNGVFKVASKEISRILSSPCCVCDSTENPTLDHIVPISRGGTHSIGNLQCLCASCNFSKRDSLPMEFKMRRLKERNACGNMNYTNQELVVTATNVSKEVLR